MRDRSEAGRSCTAGMDLGDKEHVVCVLGPGGEVVKRARVAVARKLAVLMHSMWLKGTEYQPLGYNNKNVG